MAPSSQTLEPPPNPGRFNEHLVLCTAFANSPVSAMLALDAGDSLACAGELSLTVWQTPEGQHRPSLRLLVHSTTTPHHVNRKRRAALPAPAAQPVTAEGLDDDF